LIPGDGICPDGREVITATPSGIGFSVKTDF
jgi:hypothetical protein